MNADKPGRRIILAAVLMALAGTMPLAGTSTTAFAQNAYVPMGDIRALLFGSSEPPLKLFDSATYYGWPPHRVYPVNGKITIEYAKCEPLNWEITVPNQAWKRADRATEASHRSLLLVRHNPDVTISLAGEPAGIEAKDTNRTVLIASQEKMKVVLGATILPGQQVV
jgi:hypothetical protein